MDEEVRILGSFPALPIKSRDYCVNQMKQQDIWKLGYLAKSIIFIHALHVVSWILPVPVLVRSALAAISEKRRREKRCTHGNSIRESGLGSVSGCLSSRTLSFHVLGKIIHCLHIMPTTWQILVLDQASSRKKLLKFSAGRFGREPFCFGSWCIWQVNAHMQPLTVSHGPKKRSGLTLSLTSKGHLFSLRNFRVSTWPCREAQ